LASTRLAAYTASEGGGFIQKRELGLADLGEFRRIRLINAMLDLADEVEITEIRDGLLPDRLLWKMP
jgi:hypothetical protein